VQEANVFTSVYGKAYLDPNYTMMTRLLNQELKGQVSDIYRNYTIFMISNAMFNALGYTLDPSVSADINLQWRFTPPAGSTLPATTGSSTRNDLLRILNLHVIPNRVMTDLSGEGTLKTYGEEYVGYKNNTVFAAGNVEANNAARVTGNKTAKNGRVFYIDRLLDFSRTIVGSHIEILGTPTASQYNFFWQFLKNSTIWNNATKEIAGVANGSFYTLFVPNNAAIQRAVNEGALPGTGNGAIKTPNFNPTTNVEKAQVQNFILYHFLDKREVGADGSESGAFPTILKTNLGDATTIFVNNTPGFITLSDMNGRTAKVVSATSYYISNRLFIHLTDNYLKYTF
jgi:uncharacterized surface protein with fasciclin (FAS1) repeats